MRIRSNALVRVLCSIMVVPRRLKVAVFHSVTPAYCFGFPSFRVYLPRLQSNTAVPLSRDLKAFLNRKAVNPIISLVPMRTSVDAPNVSRPPTDNAHPNFHHAGIAGLFRVPRSELGSGL